MKTLEREKIINKIVDDFNEHQIHDSYYFEYSGIQIIWDASQEVYLILNKNKTWDYSEPKHLDEYVDDLKDQDLKKYDV